MTTLDQRLKAERQAREEAVRPYLLSEDAHYIRGLLKGIRDDYKRNDDYVPLFVARSIWALDDALADNEIDHRGRQL